MGLVWYLYLSDTPCSHLEIVCRTTFNLMASSSCESPFAFLIAFMFSCSITGNLISFICYHYYVRNCPLPQATHSNIHCFRRDMRHKFISVAALPPSEGISKVAGHFENMDPFRVDRHAIEKDDRRFTLQKRLASAGAPVKSW